MREFEVIIDSFFQNPIFFIGYYGPIIVLIINIYLMRHRFFWLYIYLFFVVINTYINKALKILIKEPRPSNWKTFIEFEKLKDEEQYGMPSGHAQSISFSIFFYYLLFGITPYIYVMLSILLLALFQRWYNRNHTILQLIIGLVVGGLFAYIVYYISNNYKKKISLWCI